MLLVKNGRVINPSSGVDGYFDILIDGDKIVEVCRGGEGEREVDYHGLLMPRG